MKKVVILIGVLIVSLFFAVSCKKSTEEEKTNIKKSIEEIAVAVNTKNIDAYMTHIDESNPDYGNIKEMVYKILSVFELKMTVPSIKILRLEPEKAVVEVVQELRKVTGPDFKDHTTTVIHHMVNNGGKWKIVKTDTIKLDFFNAPKPNEVPAGAAPTPAAQPDSDAVAPAKNEPQPEKK